MSEAMPLQPEQSFARGRFVLVKRLGRGGMGEVWLARDERLREPVALKFLPPEIRGDAGALEDLCRETARSHKLSHANIVRIHDLYEDPDGMAFIVMEYIDGPTLAALRLQQPSRVLSWEYLRPLVAQLCAALEYAHGEKVIHRDLKPANLMVDSRGRLKLADFGIAAVASDSMSRISMRHSTSGTLPYMSPQQLTGQRPQAADDIYALGATLYELLTGKPPFHTGDITHQVLHQAPEPMEDRLAELGMANDIPPDVAALIMACLAKEPGQRPQSARAVAEWIGLELEGKPTTDSLSAALFPQTPPTPASLVAGKPERRDGSKPARFGRNLAAVGIAALVMAGAFWLRKTSLRLDHSNAPVAANVPAPTEPASELQAPPAGAPPEAAATEASAAPAAAPTVQTSTKPALPAAGLDQVESWTFTTIAGKAGSKGATDGIGSDARFNHPLGIAVDKEGNLYVSEHDNHTIRLIRPSGVVSTLAGLAGIAGSSDGEGSQARFKEPDGIALDNSGTIYVSDNNNHTIRKITPLGKVTTLAGRAGSSGSTDGPGTVARFNCPRGIAVGPDENIYLVDGRNNTVRKITPGGEVSTLAGKPGVAGSMDGPRKTALFDGLNCIAVGGRGFVYVTESGNHIIRSITPIGVVSTLAGQAGLAGSAYGVTTNARFNHPFGLAVDKNGSIYVTDEADNTIRIIKPSGVVNTVAGRTGIAGSNDGAGAVALFNNPLALALDTQGNIYVVDKGNNTIRKGIRHAVQPTANVESQSRTSVTTGMALIPAGSFTMGDSLDGEADALPTVNVIVSAFYMDTNLVSYSQWQSVYDWAISHGYAFKNAGLGKAPNHPVLSLDWYDVVKWSNARSQKAGLTPVYYTDEGLKQIYTNGEVTPYANWKAGGYRLPTEAEWEKAARGGLTGQRFPWGHTISESQANYAASKKFSYDLGPVGGNAAFHTRAGLYTSPVGFFAPNGYGLCDMAGNEWEWCWDWYGTPYGQPTTSNPTGPPSGSARVLRGGDGENLAHNLRCAVRDYNNPADVNNPPKDGGSVFGGFRCVMGI